MCVDLALELELLLSTLHIIVKQCAMLSRWNRCDTHCWRIRILIFLRGCYSKYITTLLCYFVTSYPSTHFLCFQFKIYDDAWCGYSDVIVSSVRSYCDKTVRKLFSVYVCVQCYIYIVKMFKSLHFKWLAKVLYLWQPTFLEYIILISQILHHFCCFLETCKLGDWKYLLYGNDLVLHLSLYVLCYVCCDHSFLTDLDLWNAACLYDSIVVYLL